LAEANRLRAAARWQAADAAYERVWRSAPKSSSAYVARVAQASVRLEHLGDARGALTAYRAALAQSPDGPLGEEIRFGIAEALRRRGDARQERDALERFLAAYPDSPLATRARQRLAALAAREPTP
jgi:tetratricopeptide (TPR) repeat protein